DPDGNVRQARLEYRLEGERFESFVRRLYALGVRAGLPARPLPAGDAFLVNYRGGPRTFPWIPYYRVLDGEVSPAAFRGKIVLAGWALAVGLFVLWHAWAAAVAPTLALVLAYGTTVVVEFVREQREKRRLSRFFSPAVLREIVRHKDDAHLGSSRRLVTVLFS